MRREATRLQNTHTKFLFVRFVLYTSVVSSLRFGRSIVPHVSCGFPDHYGSSSSDTRLDRSQKATEASTVTAVSRLVVAAQTRDLPVRVVDHDLRAHRTAGLSCPRASRLIRRRSAGSLASLALRALFTTVSSESDGAVARLALAAHRVLLRAERTASHRDFDVRRHPWTVTRHSPSLE